MMIRGIFFSVFHFLKKIYSISTTIISNRVISFLQPPEHLGKMSFQTFRNECKNQEAKPHQLRTLDS